VVMLIIYYMASLANYVPTTPIASVLCMSIVILLIVMIVRNMTKSDFIAAISGMVLETILLLLFILNRDSFEGLFATSVAQMSLFERFYIFVYGICDLGSIVYFLSVVAVFLFLSVQSMEKRRWSE
jgi:ABC-2 type transport system permease protein